MTEPRAPGAEKPVARHEPTATVGLPSIDDLPDEQFEPLASYLRARDVASMLPDDVPGIGSRRKV